jgi:replication initiation protein RepC
VVLAAILQRSSLINSAGGYLRNLTEKARAGAFSLGPMLMALIRANLRKGSQKMRA